MVREEGFFEEVMFEQRPEVKGMSCLDPHGMEGHALGKVSRPGRGS